MLRDVKGCHLQCMQNNSLEDVPNDSLLGKKNRVLKRKQFLYIQKRGRRFNQACFLTFSIPSNSFQPKVGFTVSKRVGNACVRNLVKRRLRHLYRTHKSSFSGSQLIIIANPKSANTAFQDLKPQFMNLVKFIQNSNPRG